MLKLRGANYKSAPAQGDLNFKESATIKMGGK